MGTRGCTMSDGHLLRMVPSESLTTLATSFTVLLKLCMRAATSRAGRCECIIKVKSD